MSERTIDRVTKAVGDHIDGYADPVDTPNNWLRARSVTLTALKALRNPPPYIVGIIWQHVTQDKREAGILRLGPGPGVTDWWNAAIDAIIAEANQ